MHHCKQGHYLTCLVPARVVISRLVTGCCRLIGMHRKVLRLMSWDCRKQGLRAVLLLLLNLQATHVCEDDQRIRKVFLKTAADQSSSLLQMRKNGHCLLIVCRGWW